MTTQGDGTGKRKRGRPRKNPVSEEVIIDQEGTGEGMAQASVTTPAEEALPRGMNSGDLFASEEEHELEIVHKGQTWSFKYKDLTWGDKNLCIDQAQQWDTDGGSFKFSIQKYFAAALTRMLTSTPIRPITEMTLQSLDRAVGEKLIQIVPNPVEDTEILDEVKKA